LKRFLIQTKDARKVKDQINLVPPKREEYDSTTNRFSEIKLNKHNKHFLIL